MCCCFSRPLSRFILAAVAGILFRQMKPIPQQAIDEAYRRVFESPYGRIVAEDLIGTYLLGHTYARGEAEHSIHLNGKRELVLEILERAKVPLIKTITAIMEENNG